jgi:dTDP-4-dehydrorhamnose 3,5-epimerase-like enzyme
VDLPIERLQRRHQDARGELAIALDQGDPPAEVVELAEFVAAGVVRGGHVHDRCSEVVYVAAGSLDVELLHLDGHVQRAIVPAGARVRIPPGVAHRFTAREPSRAVCLLAGGDPARDRRIPPDAAWSGTP